MKEIIVDVRESDEFNAESIEGSVHIPLSHFDSVAPGTLSHFMDRKVIIMCRSGVRAKMAHDRAKRLGFQPTGGYEVFEGGILEWKKQNRPTVLNKKRHLPILRQTHITAGLMGLTGVVLGFLLHPGFFLIAGIVAAGLTFAGLSGICLMSGILGLAPWNKNVATLDEEICIAGSGGLNCNKK